MMDLTCSFLVVSSGKPAVRSKRIWWPKIERVPIPVRSRFSTPSVSTRSIKSRYWRMVLRGSAMLAESQNGVYRQMRDGRSARKGGGGYDGIAALGAILEGLHHGFAEAIDRKHRPLAAPDRNRRNEAAGDDHHAGFQIAAAFGEMIGEPGERRARILGLARAGGLAADREAAGNTHESRDRYGFGRANDHAAIPAILDDQRQGLRARVIRIAVLDQLERGHRARDRRRDRLTRPWRAGSRQIGAEL